MTTFIAPSSITKLHFFLMPDRTSARRVRRLIAEQGGAIGLVVGTWLELLDQAQKAYLLPAPVSSWAEKITNAAAVLKDSFWSASLLVAPDETVAALDSTLSLLLDGAGTAGRLIIPPAKTLSARAFRHLNDLARLHEAMDYILPPQLAAIADVLAAAKENAVRTVSVYYHSGGMRLNPWQQALIDKLCSDAGGRDVALNTLFTGVATPEPAGEERTSLARLQKGLFGRDTAVAPFDDSVQWLAVRDFLEEIEVAVGMVQQALGDDAKLSTADIGFLVPNDQNYVDALRNVCNHAGLPVSGLPREKQVRDLGREAVLYFLLTRRRPAPAMALATLLASSLMPWGSKAGNILAQQVMDGNFRLDASDAFPAKGKKMLRLIRKEADTSQELADSLAQYATLLRAPKEMEVHLEHALSTIEKVKSALSNGGEISWGNLMRIAAPESISVPVSSAFTREGAAIFTEQEEPWRKVRQLFVLGFNNGRYPTDPSRSAVFSDDDLARLQEAAGYAIETADQSARRRRILFQHQLACASRRVNFFLSRRDCFGKELRPSQSLAYMAKLFGVNDPDDLVLELERSEDRAKAYGIATASPACPVPPRKLKKRDLFLKQDLLAHHCYEDGSPRPQSPSSLDTLMVSPFAWLLSRSGLQPREWAPESLDVASRGTLAHDVFENLFRPGQPLPSAREINDRVPPLLNQAIIRKKPFLLSPEWHVERRHLQRDIEIAALRWKDVLEELDAKILGNEVWLRGKLDTLPIHGSADLLLELPMGRLYVVDYKKAGSGPRRERMKKGFDSQASLYRLMIETGGGGKEADDSLKKAIEGAKEISVAYFMMNDQIALADSSGWVGKNVAIVEELGSGIADNAMKLIRQRITELRAGNVKLNHENDPDWYKKNAAITIYALDNSPLISLFMKTDQDLDTEGTSLQGEDRGKRDTL